MGSSSTDKQEQRTACVHLVMKTIAMQTTVAAALGCTSSSRHQQGVCLAARERRSWEVQFLPARGSVSMHKNKCVSLPW